MAGLPGLPSSTSYRVLVSVVDGLHAGAAFISEVPQGAVVGASADCDVVLLDDGVFDRMFRVFEQEGQLGIDVMADGLRLAGEVLAQGPRVLDEPVVVLSIGGAALRIELLRRTRRDGLPPVDGVSVHAPTPPAAAQRQWATFAMAGMSAAAVLVMVLVGGAVGASAHRASPERDRTLASVVDTFNRQGAKIAVSQAADGLPQLRGLVADPQVRSRLERELRAADLRVDLQLHDAQQMGESLARLVRLGGHPCDVQYLGLGRFACDAGVAAADVVERLQALKEQVPGVVAFEVSAKPTAPVPVAVTPVEPPRPVAVAPRPKVIALPVIRHVALGERVSFAIDASGRRLRVGDVVDGSKVQRIQFDTVVFVREGQRYSVSVTPMLTAGTAVAVRTVPVVPAAGEGAPPPAPVLPPVATPPAAAPVPVRAPTPASATP